MAQIGFQWEAAKSAALGLVVDVTAWERECNVCHTLQPIENFPPDRGRCRTCDLERQRRKAAQRRVDPDQSEEIKRRDRERSAERVIRERDERNRKARERHAERKVEGPVRIDRRMAIHRDPARPAIQTQDQRREKARASYAANRTRALASSKADRSRHDDGVARVYFILSVRCDLIKIGWSKLRPEWRMRQLQVGSADELRLLGWIPAKREEESRMHDRFRACHVRNEWFAASADLTNYIAAHAAHDHGR